VNAERRLVRRLAREITSYPWSDNTDLANLVVSVLRENPVAVVNGEIRDVETIEHHVDQCFLLIVKEDDQ
jgi:Tfp pilus assembly pilus retraction ATPase PilT